MLRNVINNLRIYRKNDNTKSRMQKYSIEPGGCGPMVLDALIAIILQFTCFFSVTYYLSRKKS